LKHFKTDMQYEKFPTVSIEGIVVRCDSALPGKDAEDDRATGLLLVDEFDAIYDQTFFGSEGSLHLDHLYGIVRIKGIREILRAKLNAGEALLTESRDGFDKKKDLYKALEKAITPHVDDVFKKEIARRSNSENALSKSAEKKLRKAFEKLNDLFDDLTKQAAAGTGEGGHTLKLPESMEFEDARVQLRVGTKRRIRLLANSAVIKPDSTVVIDSDSAHIHVEPTSTTWTAVPKADGLLLVNAVLTADRVGDAANILALAQSVDGSTKEATLAITDVTAATVVDPPLQGIEFSPQMSTAAPGRRGQLGLLVDTAQIPLGTDIQISRLSGDAAVVLIGPEETDASRITISFAKEHLLPGGAVGRIGISYRGKGFGQKASFAADCFVGKKNFRAEALVKIEQSANPSGGTFRNVDYADLPGSMKKSSSEFDRTTGIITINRLHPINRAAFGIDNAQFSTAIDEDLKSQWRFAEIIVDQCLYHTAAVAYDNSQLVLPMDDVVGGFRRWIEQFKHDHAENVFREFVSGFRVPKLSVKENERQ
jgi:hypothetical protein